MTLKVSKSQKQFFMASHTQKFFAVSKMGQIRKIWALHYIKYTLITRDGFELEFSGSSEPEL